MRLRSTMFVIAGLLGAGQVDVAAAQSPAPRPVPPPGAAITPATGGVVAPTGTAPVAPAESAPVPAVPAETLPTTPAPVPYAGPTPNLGPAPYAGTDPPAYAGSDPASSSPAPAPYPGAAPPAPYAAPGAVAAPRAGFDLGGQSVTPLPAPPKPLDPAKIRRQPWRGRYWLSFRMLLSGPLAGETPARPGVLSVGGGGDFGWRVNNVLGLGTGLSGQFHGRTETREIGTQDTKRINNGMLYWDALFARVFLPLRRRFQPYLEVGGGLARLKYHAVGASGVPEATNYYGGQVRAALGFEGWVSTNVTLGLSALYRLNAFRDLPGHAGWTIGHGMQGAIELGFHW